MTDTAAIQPPNVTLGGTFRQLISAIQLMQEAVDALQVVVETNTEVSNALSTTLSSIIADSASSTASATSTGTAAAASDAAGTAAAGAAAAHATGTATTVTSPTPPVGSSATAAGQSSGPANDNPLAPPVVSSWYAVVVGRNPGIFPGFDGVQVTANVERIPGGRVLRFSGDTSHEDALRAFKTLLEGGRVERVQVNINRTVLLLGDLTIPGFN